MWAAEKLGISGPAVEEYFAEVVKSDLEEDGDMDVFRKVRKDFDDKGISISDDELSKVWINFYFKQKKRLLEKIIYKSFFPYQALKKKNPLKRKNQKKEASKKRTVKKSTKKNQLIKRKHLW